jgi:hypothetical protein
VSTRSMRTVDNCSMHSILCIRFQRYNMSSKYMSYTIVQLNKKYLCSTKNEQLSDNLLGLK